MIASPTPPFRLYTVRHGQTDYSLADRFCGSVDVPLNAQGLEMATAIADGYSDIPWTAVYCSPRTRTRQTVEPLAHRLGLDVHIHEGLREIEYGVWEGLLTSEIKLQHPKEYAAWEANPSANSPPQGETAPTIARRALQAVEDIRAVHPHGNVLVVSHKATLRILTCALLGIDLSLFRVRIHQQVGAMNVFELSDSGAMLRVLGDTSHLPAKLRVEQGS